MDDKAQATPSDHVTVLGRQLARALRLLGDLGEKEAACELAAEAWSLLRHTAPKEAERMNGVLHYLTRTKCQKEEASFHG